MCAAPSPTQRRPQSCPCRPWGAGLATWVSRGGYAAHVCSPLSHIGVPTTNGGIPFWVNPHHTTESNSNLNLKNAILCVIGMVMDPPPRVRLWPQSRTQPAAVRGGLVREVYLP